MANDVVAELDRWLAVWSSHFGGTQSVDMEVVQRARDEIVGLRGLLEHSDRTVITAVVVATPAIRDEALEEAARLHENIDPACDHERQKGHPGAGAMGAVIRYRDAIRALKDKRHD